jgi:DedD protein
VADNDNLELKKRSRRRLVGAAALALLAALILPMIMDDEPGLPAHDIQVSIPDRAADAALARPIGGRPLVIVEDEAYSALPDEQLGSSEVEELSAPVVVEAAPVTPTPSRSIPEPVAPPPSARPAVPETPVVRAPPQAPAAPDLDEAARVQAILEGRMGATPPASGAFMVQVGAFGEREKAESLRQELVARGFSAAIESAGGVNRVRVGPYPSREEAERAEARLSAAGRPGVVIAR